MFCSHSCTSLSVTRLGRDDRRSVHGSGQNLSKRATLKMWTEGRDVDGSRGSNKKQVKNLGRCANSAQFSLLVTIDDIRTARHIESAVRERANCARDSRGYHPGPTNECTITWRVNLWGTLSRRLSVHGTCNVSTTSAETAAGDVLETRKIEQRVQRSIDAEPSVPPIVMVRCCFCTWATLPADHLFGL